MEQIGFRYEVSVRLRFTEAELNHLILLSQNHYDGKCQAASVQGGFLYGMRNVLLMERQQDKTADSLEWTFTPHDLGTLHKISESEHCGHFNSVPISLWFTLGQVQKAVVKEWERVSGESGE